MAALDVERARATGSVTFGCGYCRERLTRHFVAEHPSERRMGTSANRPDQIAPSHD
jgi:hypothetical protein